MNKHTGDEKILTINELQNLLKDRNLKEVSKNCNASYSAVRAISRGEVRSYSYDTLIKLSNYFNRS